MENYEAIIMIAAALAVLFFGYRIKKIAFFIVWFLLGFNILLYFMPNINELVPEIANNTLYQILLPIAGGLLLALMGFSIEKLCVGAICFALIMIITINYFGTDLTTLAVGAVIGVLGAGLGVTLMKPAIIIATSLAGGYALTVSLLSLFPDLSLETFYFPILLGSAAIGAIFQFTTTKHID